MKKINAVLSRRLIGILSGKLLRIIVLFLFFGFFILVISFLWQSLQVKKINIISADTNISGLSVFNGKNLLLIDTAEIKEKLLAGNIYLKDLTLKKIYPGQIQMDTVWRIPVARIINSSTPLYIDSEGFPAKPPPDPDLEFLPQIEVTRAVFNKNKADWRVIKAVSLINELNKKEIGVDSVGFSSSSAHIRAVVDDSVEVFMPVTADPSYLSASLQTIISRFRIEGNFIAKVDFRFDKPVVILKNE
ncbi:hypothetical protein A3D05_05055 [Candidatus Gottesmanbacteria bacterium RIFCSPHIGHO2_02_FULL_40_24]|uniref:POTRA domain-containing protein n=1 Tax=Candidatus Gottesmanbacteria bacterium RIFCSPHIGHO2_01_FULL_40_15 TaxID=1798376 RepID=A0A1F5Z242_9BACT|nr:MAG: hypothetical protein A2777_06085 [Candidatus Gottesmanbacteria bacterium RIFCSPHIGHO2_01_FULL_40_15]OGG16238.1 MAG: hypothetical protein A3D05_05055 [Candidatus Gottesmanbacteria bacterium RIFCSPHIGHO2_02_FULL_40_24]OGG23230.1 MAG: hypothetical protein A3B48_00435 [Candidatus Gottesmanbacteria bacterium RIFCSPLOWO2_01_FULL_40_10]OGG25907.1 MAG: hypothetical protein A3E42_06330 [Candidatus Gottesmanbacteria bacterium RIFCSPHIGHO2_12_FULL_40_13]OGG33766.1 MAG: hypothetical protein A3I80_0